MSKEKKAKVLLFSSSLMLLSLALALTLSLSGCADEKECEFNSDCQQKECFRTTCSEDSKCVSTAMPNCCGNTKCEYSSDGKSYTENYCTCPKDCSGPKDKCAGHKLLSENKYGGTYTEYLRFGCNEDDECVLDFDRSEQREIPFVFEKQLTYLKLGVTSTIKKPFDINSDKINVEVVLKDRLPTLSGPVRIDNIQLLKGSTLYGKVDLSKDLSLIGDKLEADVPITFEPETVESEQSIEIKVEYSFNYTVNQNTGETKTRNAQSISSTLSEKLFLVKPGEEFVPGVTKTDASKTAASTGGSG